MTVVQVSFSVKCADPRVGLHVRVVGRRVWSFLKNNRKTMGKPWENDGLMGFDGISWDYPVVNGVGDERMELGVFIFPNFGIAMS